MTLSAASTHPFSSNCPRCAFPKAPKRCPTCNGKLTAYDLSGFDPWEAEPPDCGKLAHVVMECPKKHYAFAIKLYCWTPGCAVCGHLQ
jgi:hypothetical protein